MEISASGSGARFVRFKRVNGLENVLRHVKDVRPERELTSQQMIELHINTEGCRNVLVTLNKKPNKYHKLDSDLKSLHNKRLSY